MRILRVAALTVVVLPVAVVAVACGSTPPPPAKGAYAVSFRKNGSQCLVESHNGAVGEVAANSKANLAVDGLGDAEIECSVTGTGSFAVEASIYQAGNLLQVTIPSIAPGATEEAPASGSIGFASVNTQDTYTGNCNFFFIPETSQGVAAGKLWVAFKCDAISADQSTCGVDPGYVIFENCSTGSEDEEEE